MKKTLENEENLTLVQGMVEQLIVEDGVCKGIVTQTGAVYRAKTVVITTGTYLRGEIILGDLKYSSGPNNQQPSIKLSDHLQELGFHLVRFKTGTPPRVNGNTIDYSKTEIQPGDDVPRAFSYETTKFITDQLPCWLTYTNETTHGIINENLHRAPMFSGMVKGTGARYCPSIEDKIVRFSDKPRHQIFLEPEGRNTDEVYVQGLSTSMPEDVQQRILKTIPGLENVQMMRAGYAIEYDAVEPSQLWPTGLILQGLLEQPQRVSPTARHRRGSGRPSLGHRDGGGHRGDALAHQRGRSKPRAQRHLAPVGRTVELVDVHC